MHRSINIQNSLPVDISLKIVSSLQVFDVCSLGSCSRFWRELCGSDYVWETLFKDRWPKSFADQNSQIEFNDQKLGPNSKRWRDLYMSKHNEIAGKVCSVTNLVDRALAHEGIEVGNYLKAVELLNSHQFGFIDVQIFLLNPKLDVLINLVGLHYCIIWLQIPAENLTETLDSSHVSERKVCVQWWKLGGWFRLRDEFYVRYVLLGDLAASGKEVLGVLHRGVIHEVIRVQISAV